MCNIYAVLSKLKNYIEEDILKLGLGFKLVYHTVLNVMDFDMSETELYVSVDYALSVEVRDQNKAV